MIGLINTDPARGAVKWLTKRTDLTTTNGYDPNPITYRHATTPDQFRDHVAALADAGITRIVVDSPGELRSEDMLLCALSIATGVVVPTTPRYADLDGTDRIITELLKPTGTPYRVVLNMWDSRDGRRIRDEAHDYITARGWSNITPTIRMFKTHERLPLTGELLTDLGSSRRIRNVMSDVEAVADALTAFTTPTTTTPTVTVVANQKGGVGKTTTAVNLAAILTTTTIGADQ